MAKNEYEIVKGKFSDAVLFTSEYTPEQIDKIMHDGSYKEIYLRCFYNPNYDFSFLTKYSHYLEGLEIVGATNKNYHFVNQMINLKYLNLQVYSDDEIDLNNFVHLENCIIQWQKTIKNLFDCLSLKSLSMSYDKKDLDKFSNLVNLEYLQIKVCPATSLLGLSKLKKLKNLKIFQFTKLESLDGVEKLLNLEELVINTCKKITNINNLANLTNLKKIVLNNLNDIDSIKPLVDVTSLEDIEIMEDTNIIDGDLNPLIKGKKIKRLVIADRPHYSHLSKDLKKIFNI